MMNTGSQSYAEIDLDALIHNFRCMEQLAGPSKKLIASIKGNAYGHGVVEVAQALETAGAYALMTGSLDEARDLRDHGITLPILLFAFSTDELALQAAREGFVPTLTSHASARTLSREAKETVSVYLKIDTGLGRLGEPLASAREFVERTSELKHLQIDGIYTHVPFSQTSNASWAVEKLKAFDHFLATLESDGHAFPVTQAMASSCLLAGLKDNCSAVCLGHALYGLSPFSVESHDTHKDLKPVLTGLKSTLIHIGHLQAGSDIAIGGLYGLERPRTVGVLPLGLAQGISSPQPDKELVTLVAGRRCRVLSVSLEHCTIDLDGAGHVVVGDPVTLIGYDGEEQMTLAEVAGASGIGPLEMLMQFSGRIPIRYPGKSEGAPKPQEKFCANKH
tara:strand:+ start:1661 stop:2836 length:1176 start_codon:yes stop_codon:yes gene_type:complete